MIDGSSCKLSQVKAHINIRRQHLWVRFKNTTVKMGQGHGGSRERWATREPGGDVTHMDTGRMCQTPHKQ